MIRVGDTVTNGHWHDKVRGIQMRARVDALAGEDAWVFALTGPHSGGRLTFPISALMPVKEQPQ